jgi:threonine 3-dehydrogenase
MAAAICRHVGARHVVITDLDEGRLATARQMGASRAVAVGTDSLREVMTDLGMKEGFDVALEMSGSADAVHDILNVTNHGAKVGLLGLFRSPAHVDLNQAIFKSLTIKGIYGREMFDTWYKAVAMLDSGLDISPVISHRLPLEDFETAFELMLSGDANKVILKIAP